MLLIMEFLPIRFSHRFFFFQQINQSKKKTQKNPKKTPKKPQQ